MEKSIKKQPMLSCAIIFTVCSFARLIEYFIIRTDETVISENFLHKLFGIILLAIILRSLQSNWESIGFIRNGIISDIIKGFALGGFCFIVAYSIECLILYHINQNVSLAFYISGFSLNGETAKHDSILFLSLCVVFNLINVWMEEVKCPLSSRQNGEKGSRKYPKGVSCFYLPLERKNSAGVIQPSFF